MKETVRIQFDVSPARLHELEHLMAVCQLSTKKELFNNALTLFEWAVKESQEGNLLASVNERKKRYRELQMPALLAAAAKDNAGINDLKTASEHTDTMHA